MPIIELAGTLIFGGSVGLNVVHWASKITSRGGDRSINVGDLKRTSSSTPASPAPARTGILDAGPAEQDGWDNDSSRRPSTDAGDFELWVETDLDSAWCLEGSRRRPQHLRAEKHCLTNTLEDAEEYESCSEQSWRKSCTTATLRRKWDEFEALSRPAACLATGVAPVHAADKRECLEALGLPEDVTSCQLRKAFRHYALSCHPDKCGSAVDGPRRAELAEQYCRITATVRALERELQQQEEAIAALGA